MPQKIPDYPPHETSGRFWRHSMVGQEVGRLEQAFLEGVSSKLYGRFFLQVGAVAGDFSSPCFAGLRRQFFLSPAVRAPSDLVAVPEQLPIASSSVNVLYLSHVLEYSPDPHALLREADRILIPDGRLILSLFNPYSLYGLWGYLRKEYPWSGNFIGLGRIADWLGLLGFQVEEKVQMAYRPPFRNDALFQRAAWMEAAGGRLYSNLGGVSMLLAVKREVPMSLVQAPWKKERGFVPARGLVEPTTRSDHGG